MKLLLYLLPIYFCIESYYLAAQTSKDYVEMILKIRTISELEDLIHNNQDTLYISGGISIETRALDFGINYHTYELEFESKSTNGVFPICALMLSKNDTIILNATRSLFEKEYQIQYDKSVMKQYLKFHQELYNTEVSMNSFLAELTSNYILEFGCGETGLSYSHEVKKMRKWVSNSNKKDLNTWLRSPNPELQTYGALGLTLINKNGGKLTEDEQRIIYHLKQKNNKIQMCNSCNYWDYDEFINIIITNKPNL